MAAKLESTESAAATRPLLPEPSGARKAAKLKGQVKARLLHEWLSHIYVYIYIDICVYVYIYIYV